MERSAIPVPLIVRPFTVFRRTLDAVADGDDGVEVVILHLAVDGSVALGLNCQEFLDSCLPRQLVASEDVFQMQADILPGGLKHFRNVLLGEPGGFVFQR